jgi:hypothetical protein
MKTEPLEHASFAMADLPYAALSQERGPWGHSRFSTEMTNAPNASADRTVKVWDATSATCLWTGHLLPELQVATIDAATGRVMYASPEAWRFLAWRWFDPALGRHRLLPAETFGPLPS